VGLLLVEKLPGDGVVEDLGEQVVGDAEGEGGSKSLIIFCGITPFLCKEFT